MTTRAEIPAGDGASAFGSTAWDDIPSRGVFGLLAAAFRYPAPGSLEHLEAGVRTMPRGQARRALENFTRRIKAMSLEGWEELYTRTLDLAPLVAPYIGYQIWGDAYQRGEFMAALNRTYGALGLETEGELPDHLAPVLHYLERAEAPIPELQQTLEPALKAMHKTLRTLDAKNPYLSLLEAVTHAVGSLRVSR